MGNSSQIVGRALSLVTILTLMLVVPLLLTRCNQRAGSTDLSTREVLVKPMPTRGGFEARFARGEIYRNLPTHSPADVAGRLQTVRELCASLPALEKGPMGRLTNNDAELVQTVLDALPFRDVTQRIDWAKPIIGADTQRQEMLISGGQFFGAFQCVDELAAAVAWSQAGSEASGWPDELEECRRWGSNCLSKLQERLRVACSNVDTCARGMRWREISELSQIIGEPKVGVEYQDPFAGSGFSRIKELVEKINAAKLAQNPG